MSEEEFDAKSLDELEKRRQRIMEEILNLAEESQPLSPLSSPVAESSPSPKRFCLEKERAAGGRDSSSGENGFTGSCKNVHGSSPISALHRVVVERVGCASPEFASLYDERISVWRTEIFIGGCVCGSAEGRTKEAAESQAARIVLDKYSKEEANSSLDRSMESIVVSEQDESLSEDDVGNSDLDVDELLEKPFGRRTRNIPPDISSVNGRRKVPMFREKIVLKHRSTEYFEVLPDGWIEITHQSGLPVYLHKMSRVCTFSRPYFIGPGSVRNHEVPVASIPCLHQKRIREQEAEAQKQRAEAEACQQNGAEADNDPLRKLGAPKVQLQTAKDFKSRNLNPSQLHAYASDSFQFEKAKLWRFRTWSESRTHHRKKREQAQFNETLQHLGRPSLPSNVKLITVPSLDAGSKPTQKQFFLNPQGKTSIAVLHEYVQKVLKGTVKYVFIETKNAANPYGVTVKVIAGSKQREKIRANLVAVTGSKLDVQDPEEVDLGSGYGNSKKIAKLDAAKKALQVLVPGLDFDDDGMVGTGAKQDDVVALFDLIPVTDSRVGELSAKSGQPAPFVILQECLKRHSAFGNTRIETKMERSGHQTHHFTMHVGKHEVRVHCTNKKEGKQKASQHMLEKLHPQIKTWGSLLRLYGYGAQRKLQETRKEKDSIIKLQGQNRATSTEPNHAILDKLRQEMRRLHPNPVTDTSASGKGFGSLKNIDI